MRTHRAHPGGFTLLELVFVMIIIATVIAVAAPSLSGWGRGSRLRDETDQLLAATRWARTQAVSTATPHRLHVETATGRYWLTARDGLEFVPAAADFGRQFAVPTGYRIELLKEGGAAVDAANAFVEFSANGRCEPAQLRLRSDRGEVVLLACPSPAEGFVVIPAAGGTS